jgi:hypothetical protein
MGVLGMTATLYEFPEGGTVLIENFQIPVRFEMNVCLQGFAPDSERYAQWTEYLQGVAHSSETPVETFDGWFEELIKNPEKIKDFFNDADSDVKEPSQ